MNTITGDQIQKLSLGVTSFQNRFIFKDLKDFKVQKAIFCSFGPILERIVDPLICYNQEKGFDRNMRFNLNQNIDCK